MRKRKPNGFDRSIIQDIVNVNERKMARKKPLKKITENTNNEGTVNARQPKNNHYIQ
jgi:hypothetical protein